MNLAVFHFVFDLGCQILLLKKWQININLNISCLSLINQLIRILLLKYLLVNFQMIDFGFMIGIQRFSRKVELGQCGNVIVKLGLHSTPGVLLFLCQDLGEFVCQQNKFLKLRCI